MIARKVFGGSHRRALVSISLSVALLAALAFVTSVATAAESPKWAVTVVPTPTKLVPESPRSQVEQLAVEATGGTYKVGVQFELYTKWTKPLPYNADASTVEAAINALFGNGESVTVTGGPGASAPYTITWGGAAANRGLENTVVRIHGLSADAQNLTGPQHTADVTKIAEGISPPVLLIDAINVGAAATKGEIRIEDALPAGITATSVTVEDQDKDWVNIFGEGECEGGSTVSCKYSGTTEPGDLLIVSATLSVAGGLPASVTNKVTVSGGSAEPAEVSTLLPVGGAIAAFGVAPGSVVTTISNKQAGAHPNITTAFTLTTSETDVVAQTPKDVHFDLPVGFVGSTVGIPRCSMHGVIVAVEHLNSPEACPAAAMVGEAHVMVASHGVQFTFPVPVYNIAPAPGEPAAFGFSTTVVPTRLDTSVLSNGDYGVRVRADALSEIEPPMGAVVTIWGVPADHNGPGPDFTVYNLFESGSFGGPSSSSRVPLLTGPQQCSEPLSAVMTADPWVSPGDFISSEALSLGTPTGCEQLRASAKFSMVPDTLEAGAPAGYHFDLKVPQNEAPDGLGTPNVKNVSLKLPVGTVVNPSAAWGLKACSSLQFYGPNHPSQEPAEEAKCPREAQVGTVQVKTPALEEALEGQVYLAEPECSPCSPADAEDGKMVKLYVQAISEGEGGIVVKLEGKGMIDQKTGQITTVFENNPQLPFNEFKLTLAGGPRAVLANPRTCGSATSNLDLTPWSTPVTPDVTPDYTFEINQNCFGSQFNPSFVAGMPNIQAGAYSGFTLAFGRADNDEYVSQLSTSMPTGLLGKIAGIPLCKEAQAINGSCDAASQIGTVEALTGPGANPFLVSGGHVFLTEGYGGAPYGLSIVVPAVAGPYTLSGTNGAGSVVVRAQIFVDEHSAQLTVVSGQLPSMLDGIPLQLKAVNVRIDKPGFTFNPTSCNKTAIVGKLGSVEGLSATISDPFQVTNCAGLAFKPGFKVSTSGKTSRSNGASLDVKLSYPAGSFGKAANIKSVKVDLPKQLPSRLTTLQKACPDSTFNLNPAGCPVGSRVGVATATTPILADTLTGPAYFVSHGGAKFPELVVVLSGDGVTVQLDGETFISKAGITSSTFRQVPDVPVSTFELKLPEASNSALAANGNLCTTKLTMPTAFTAQNGMVIHQSTPITVTGCPKHKAKAVKHKKKTKKGKK